MTFVDDYIQLNLGAGRRPMRVTLAQLGLDWPPPEFIAIAGGPFSTPVFKRVSYSQISDDDRAKMTRVCRGAEYVHAGPDMPPEKATVH